MLTSTDEIVEVSLSRPHTGTPLIPEYNASATIYPNLYGSAKICIPSHEQTASLHSWMIDEDAVEQFIASSFN